MDPTRVASGRTGRKPYPAELRERSVRMVLEHRGEYGSDREAIKSIAGKMGMHCDTLKVWVRQAKVDSGERPGLTTDERERLRLLEREVRELRRANEMAFSSSQRNEF